MSAASLAGGSLATGAAGGILGAFGSIFTGDATKDSDDYKAQVAANNAIIAQRNADAATSAGGVAAQQNDLKTKNLVGQQTVAQASNGLDVGSGTNVNVRQTAVDLGHLDTLTILNNAAKNSAGFKAQGMNFTAESQLDTAAGENAQTAGYIGAGTSLLGGASSVSGKWLSYQQKGVFS